MSKENVLRTEYGICPKCNGNGWVFPTNVSSSMTEVCNYCNGTKSVVTAVETKPYERILKWSNPLPENKIKEQGTDTKDWGIVSVEDGVANGSQGKGKIVYIQKGDESSWIKANIKINSVKRLSDGVVFSIGDYVGITKESGKSIKGWKDIIESFLIVDDTMVSVFKTFRQPINDLDKLTPTEETDKAVEKQCQGIYNQAIDHAIGIINARLGDDLPIPNPLVTEIINSLNNLKKK